MLLTGSVGSFCLIVELKRSHYFHISKIKMFCFASRTLAIPQIYSMYMYGYEFHGVFVKFQYHDCAYIYIYIYGEKSLSCELLSIYPYILSKKSVTSSE